MHTIGVVLAIALAMLALERIRPARRFRASAGWWLRAVAINLVQAALVVLGTITWEHWLPGLGPMTGAGWPLPVQVLAGYLLVTFVYYWWHRARHEVPVLWRWLHQIHHSAARIEVMTTFYKHPLEMFVNALLNSFLLHVALGITPAAAALTVLVAGVAELLYHWNMRTPYWLGFFFQRPEMHCIHHRRRYHRNNFSDLPVWDMLFGTFENPREPIADCGFSGEREQRLLDMLLGRDLNQHPLSSRQTSQGVR